MRGILFPPSLLQAQQEGAGQQVHGDMVMPTGPGAGLVFVHAHVALAGFELGFNGPPGPCHIGQRLERRLRGGVGQIVARFAAIQVLAVEDPTLRARLAPGRSARPLGDGPGPFGGPMGGRGCGLRHVAGMSGQTGGGRLVVRLGRECPDDRVAADTDLDRPSLSGLRPPPQPQTAAGTAAHGRGAQPGLAARRVAGGDHGAGPPYLPLQRAAGARHLPVPAGSGGLGPLPPKPGWQRAALLPLQRPGGDAAADAGPCGRVQMVH